jgi:hypothetical protein
MDSQALDHPLHTAMGKNGPPMMNLRGATGKPITDEYIDKFGIEAYAEFDKEVYIQVHGKEAYDAKFGELEAIGQEGTWEPCHKYMLGHGIVGVENWAAILDKITNQRFRFYASRSAGTWATALWSAAWPRSTKRRSTRAFQIVPTTYCGTGYGPANETFSYDIYR